MPKVSIIIPIYNVEKFLDRCLDSVRSQTLRDIEIILVDDDSPDHCPQMCEEYARQDSRIKVVHKKNGGLGFARNSGLEVATGEYIAFCDSDDYVKKDSYETLYGEAKKEGADVVFGWHYKETNDRCWIDFCKIKENKIFVGTEVKQFMMDLVAFSPSVKSRSERLIDVSSCMALYRKDIFDKYNVRFMSEREIVSEDLVFNVDYLKHAKLIKIIPYTFYYYCHNTGSLSTTFKVQKFEGFKRLREALSVKLKECDPLCLRSNRVFIGYTRAHIISLMKSTTKEDRKSVV